MLGECKTIKEELEKLGIVPQDFEEFYTKLMKDNKVPSEDILPHSQYEKIVGYLMDKKALGEDCSIKEEGLKVFSSRKELEETLEILSKTRRAPHKIPSRGGGGVSSCRHEDYEHTGSGGIVSCRDDDDDDFPGRT
ncbi:hypothetical protein KY308_01630 [Candidatus Woesearchaeota archaeon]|nr:hypothetical protein [Candidatus Woesearchaeota archaeon]